MKGGAYMAILKDLIVNGSARILGTLNAKKVKADNLEGSLPAENVLEDALHRFLSDVCKTITDWNSATTNGFYMGNGAANGPTTAWYFGQVITHNINFVYQTVYAFTASTDAKAVSKYIRVKTNGTWGGWTNVTVSKAVPSNAVFTDTNTTYSAGTGMALSGTTFNHKNSVTAGTAQGDASKTLAWGGTFKVPTVAYDAQGHVTSSGTTTMTMPGNPNTDTKNTAGSTDTSSKIFLVGATSQAANPVTYSHNTAYVGTDGCLYSNNQKVSTEGHTHDPHDRVLTCTIPTTGWSASAPYTQTVTVSGITSSDNPVAALFVPDNATAATVKPLQKAWSCVDQILTNNGSITLYCYFKKPASAFQISLKGQ